MTMRKLSTFLFLCLLVLANTTANGTDFRLCPSQCAKFTSNSNSFSDVAHIAKNLLDVMVNATSYLDIINAFGNYPTSYKLQTVQTLQGLKVLEDYGARLKAKYGSSVLAEYFYQTYGSTSCIDCEDNVFSYAGSVGATDDLLDLETISDNIDEEMTKQLIYLPFSQYPEFPNPSRRLLQVVTRRCISSSASRGQQYQCYEELNDKAHYFYNGRTQSPFESVRGEGGEVDLGIDILADDKYIGFPQMVLNSMYREAILQSYKNCRDNLFLTACN